MDGKTYEYMKERVEEYKALDNKKNHYQDIIKRIEKYPNSISHITIQGNNYGLREKDFEGVLVEYVHKKIEELESMMGEI